MAAMPGRLDGHYPDLATRGRGHRHSDVVGSWGGRRAAAGSYAQSIRRLNKELESTRMRAAERWEVLAAKERLSQRLDERLNKLYGTC